MDIYVGLRLEYPIEWTIILFIMCIWFIFTFLLLWIAVIFETHI